MLTGAQRSPDAVGGRRAEDYVDAASVPADWPNRGASRSVHAGGCRWHVQRMGAGPKLLLIHGTGASTHTWRTVLPMLAADFDVAAMDLPGHGYTDRLPGEAMSLPDLAGGVRALLREMDFDPECIAGHSAGAAIAVQLALVNAVAPACIVGLNPALLPFGGALRVLFAPMARLFASTRLMPQLITRRAGDIRAVRRVLGSTGSNIDEQGTRLYQSLLQREQHVAAVLDMMASWRLEPLLESLPQLVPGLHLVVGERDTAIAPGEADTVAALLHGAGVSTLAGCGHLAHEERPERVVHIIRQQYAAHRGVRDA